MFESFYFDRFGFSCEHEDGYPIIGVGGSSKATGATKRSGFVSEKNRKNGFQLLSNE